MINANDGITVGDALVFLYAACSQWKIEPKERYTGDFNVKTKHPVLFVGNTHDGLTPLVSAKNVSSTFEGSVVLTVDGYGVSLVHPDSLFSTALEVKSSTNNIVL